MAMKRLTKRAIDAATPNDGGDLYLFDSDVRGFGLRVRPSGAKAFLSNSRSARAAARPSGVTPSGHTARRGRWRGEAPARRCC
jgi:hypothetical protein